MPLALAICRTGMVTGVGLDTAASCAAIRAAIDNFQQSRFRDGHGEWLMACQAPLPGRWGGEEKLRRMAARAIDECLAEGITPSLESVPLLLCLAEGGREGRIVHDDEAFMMALQREIGVVFHPASAVVAQGHVSAATALYRARALLQVPGVTQVLIVGCDSMLAASTLRDCEQRERLLTSVNTDGFIPGEAAAALLLGRPDCSIGQLVCRGLGFAVEQAHIDSGRPLRADGLTAAIRAALQDAQCSEGILAFKVVDASGDAYAFKETALAFARIDRTKRTEFDVWHPADCIGEVGAAIGLIMLAILKTACEKGYARGNNVLLHLGNDDGRRAAMICSWNWREAHGG